MSHGIVNIFLDSITPPQHVKEPSNDWTGAADFSEFVPQTYDHHTAQADPSTAYANPYDPFASANNVGLSQSTQQTHINPYAQDTAALGGAAYYQNSQTFHQPLQYHLYAPIGPHRENLLAYQRLTHDFFIADSLREDLQRKSEATRQVLPNSSLPTVDHFHSLVPLDTNNQKNATTFGFPSWVYKAISNVDGNTYVLRRIEGFKLTNEKHIMAVKPWKRINNGSVVSVLDAFTTGVFGDRSLIFVTDYFPLSKSLAEHHMSYSGNSRYGSRPNVPLVREDILWGYIVQLASALKAIHSNGLAARVINPSKVILTSKDRIRLNGCAVLDVVQYDAHRSIAELQQEDLVQLGRLVLSIASNSPNATLNMQKAVENLGRTYSERMKECVVWLLSTQPPPTPGGTAAVKDIDAFLQGITTQMATVLDSTFHAEDTLVSALARELENARLVRLLTKLNFINERPEQSLNPHATQQPHQNPQKSTDAWSETGPQYYLKLFRDYVFHQVDAEGRPVVDLAHVLACLNKLDTGSEEKITLVSRDEQNCFVVSYREIKRAAESSFGDLVKAGRRQ